MALLSSSYRQGPVLGEFNVDFDRKGPELEINHYFYCESSDLSANSGHSGQFALVAPTPPDQF